MPAIVELTTQPSQPEVVDEFMRQLRHPLKEVCVALREIILAADKSMAEGIVWNAPCFFFTGKKAVQAEGIPALHRQLQPPQEGLHPAHLPDRARVEDTSGLLVGITPTAGGLPCSPAWKRSGRRRRRFR